MITKEQVEEDCAFLDSLYVDLAKSLQLLPSEAEALVVEFSLMRDPQTMVREAWKRFQASGLEALLRIETLARMERKIGRHPRWQ
jgi:hypothetical protein